ncbi:hypothetical protein [Mucilaginibacter sp. OK268]|uniref:hypothetical protein n=1 Tax=Mucilaginibacter sp. OK268 TaxID=1881048 RepID=UPI001C40B9D5|nr:hypothetical protein [Mucilaginibacter sp. OK268]
MSYNSNAGYGIGSTFQTVKELAPNSTILEGFSTRVALKGMVFCSSWRVKKKNRLRRK